MKTALFMGLGMVSRHRSTNTGMVCKWLGVKMGNASVEVDERGQKVEESVQFEREREIFLI